MTQYRKVTNEAIGANVTYLTNGWRRMRAGLVVLGAALVMAPAVSAPKAEAADWWDAGSIIEDRVFFDSGSMNESQIRAFIQEKGANCTSKGDNKCLKDLRVSNSTTTPYSSSCAALPALKDADAAKVIAEAAKACGINPQVLLVTIQKEQSGITQARPQKTWDKAMGAYCPESGCKEMAKGFARQIYLGADMLRGYIEHPENYPAMKAQAEGKPYGLKTGAASSCPKTNVKIKNAATAALYTYTPYTPNAATASAFPSASPDKQCAHTGYLIFANYMRTWFPQNQVQDFKRISGNDRVDTAVQISKQAFPDGSDTVYLGRKDLLADAQTGATLKDGPVLLVSSTGSIAPSVQAELRRLGAKNLYVLGGEQSVSPQVARSLQELTGVTPKRLAGATRFDTSRAIADRWVKIHGAPKEIYVANGNGQYGSIDAAVGSSLTAGPLLTTSNSDDIGKVSAWISNNSGSASPVAIGGTTSLTPELLGRISSKDWQRLGGKDRYETSVAIARRCVKTGTSTDTLYAATGKTLPDSAVAGVLGAGPVILVGNSLSASAASFIDEIQPSNLWIIGGPGSISDGLARSLMR